MAKAAKRPAEAWTYVLKADRALEPSQRSVFTLAPMTYAQRAVINDSMVLSALDDSRVYRTAGEMVLSHIASIENFPAGEPQPWPADRASRERYLEMLEDGAVLELGNEIWSRSALGKDEEPLKNSSAPEPMSSSGDISTAPTISIPAKPVTGTPD